MSERLTMRDVARLRLGGRDPEGKDVRKARRDLQRLQESTGVRILFGTGVLWTTRRALRSANFLGEEELRADLREDVEEIRAELLESREDQRALARVVTHLHERVGALEEKLV